MAYLWAFLVALNTYIVIGAWNTYRDISSRAWRIAMLVFSVFMFIASLLQ